MKTIIKLFCWRCRSVKDHLVAIRTMRGGKQVEYYECLRCQKNWTQPITIHRRKE